MATRTLLVLIALHLANYGVAQAQPGCRTGGPYSAWESEPIQFDGTGSGGVGTPIVSYDWEFGDGHEGQGAIVIHAYLYPGSYTVTLTTTDDDGATEMCETTATVSGELGTPNCDPNGPYAGDVGEAVEFDASGSNMPGGTLVWYEWDFGDGDWASGVRPLHEYQAAGRYTVTLTVTPDEGMTSLCETIADITPAAVEPMTWGRIKGQYEGRGDRDRADYPDLSYQD